MTSSTSSPTRRQALKSLASVARVEGTLPTLVARPPEIAEGEIANHTLLEGSDLTAVIGDNSAHDQHRAGYNGVWSLRHRADPRSIFVSTIAGLNLEHIVTGVHLEDSRTFFEPGNATSVISFGW